jgi:3-methyl-2-oxobutanoate hydroxymethyltransferase
VQGKDAKAAQKLIEDSLKVEAAGAFALVLECVPKQLAKEIQARLSIPTIGIGAGIDCDGQVLVFHDVINYGVSRAPKFVKQYVDGNELLSWGIKSYVNEVKNQQFPTDAHSFTMKQEQLSGLYGGK